MPDISIHDALVFLVDFCRSPRSGTHSYGYEIYLPNVVIAYRREVCGLLPAHYPGDDDEARSLSVWFYEAAWELCRRGILRPGVIRSGEQATDDGSGGAGFSITSAGREWLKKVEKTPFLLSVPTRVAEILATFRHRFGDGYLQRAQEAATCHFSGSYLACCVMCGAAAESILLALAIAKSGDEKLVLQSYRSSKGRSQVENLIVGQLPQPLALQFRNLTELMKYWRDDAAHGTASEISEFEAYEALARLMRFAHFADDHWHDLTVGLKPSLQRQ